MTPAEAVAWHRHVAAGCDRAACWLDDLAAGHPVTDNGPIPLELARNVPPKLLRAWANNERANRTRHLTTANDIVTRRYQR